jgi:hypothetical protein
MRQPIKPQTQKRKKIKMNTTTYHSGFRWLKPLTAVLLGALLVTAATGCKTTKQVKDVEPSGFLGDYSLLQKGVKGRAVYSYANTNVHWAKFTKVQIKPIELWQSSDPDSSIGSLSDDGKQKLVDLLHTALSEELTKAGYTVVDQPGADVLVIRAGITDMRKSNPVAGFVSSVWLPIKLVNVGVQTVSGTAFFVGGISIEGELLDGADHQRIAAFVDRRAGTTAIRSKFASNWGDIKRCDDWWAERLVERLEEVKKAPAK